ncbi:MAG: O-antigen ligase domain-containing protein, partial [Imperialibacter sp.]
MLVSFFQLSKELIVFLAIISFLLFKRDFFSLSFRLVFIDYVFLAFLGLGLLFVFLPMGSAGLAQKLMYYKNIAILGIMYFFGRNARLVDVKLGTITSIILGIAVLA